MPGSVFVQRSPSGIAGGISYLLSASSSFLSEMTANGRDFVVRERSMWTEAEKIASLLEKAADPDPCVQLNLDTQVGLR